MILSILKPVKYIFILAVIFGAISGAGRTLLIAMVGHAPVKGVYGLTNIIEFLLLLSMVFGTGLISNIWLSKISQKSIYNLQSKLCTKILKLPLANFEEIGRPRIYAILTQDITMLSRFVTIVPTLLVNSIVICFPNTTSGGAKIK